MAAQFFDFALRHPLWQDISQAARGAVRGHWQIENGLHWVLDTAFSEDENRLCTAHAAENLSRINRFALSLLKQEQTNKFGIKNKRLRAGWDEHELLKVLTTWLRGRPGGEPG